MSEFQYYEFYSIDRALTSQERDEIDRLSSRFSPTARRAVFTYSYGDFRHNVESILLQYFDFFLYMANWGTKRMMFKFPEELINYDEVKRYHSPFDGEEYGEGLKVYKKAEFVIIDIKFCYDDGGWLAESNDLSRELIGLRENILRGDYRALFIIWLHIRCIAFYAEELNVNKSFAKNLIPNNLNKLSSNLECLIDLFEIDVDWISGAARYSEEVKDIAIPYTELVSDLPLDKKNQYLIKLLQDEPNIKLKLEQEIEKMMGKDPGELSDEIITFKEIVQASKMAEEERKELRREREEKREIERLQRIEKNRSSILREIKYNLDTGSGKSYDKALEGILNLRDLAIFKQEEPEFKHWLNKLKTELLKKPAMLKRIENEGL